MPANRDAADPSPYGSAAFAYYENGWRGVLPVPPKSKRIEIRGWTGWGGIDPSYADIQAWTEDQPGGNIALRLPPYVLGIDVDAYAGKAGGATLAACEQRWGPLPATWRTTSRDDGVSGIRLFLIPPGLDWPGQLPGGGVETVHSGHRYAIAPPSIHPEGRRYRWIDPAGMDTLAFPRPDQLPALPQRWIDGLSRGGHVDEPGVDMSRAQLTEWLGNVPGVQGDVCEYMARFVTGAKTAMLASSSRHEALLAGYLQVVRAGEKGHRGLLAAIRDIRASFLDAVAADHSRSESEAQGEAERALAGAVEKVAAAPSPEAGDLDPCTVLSHLKASSTPAPSPLAALLGRPVPEDVTEPRDVLQSTGTEREASVEVPIPAIDPTSWAASALEKALLGQHEEGPPTILERADGKCLLYAGRINGIIGPSESGKTWIALEAVRQTLAAGHRVVLLDFEDSVPGVVGRLLALGIDRDVLRQRFRYVGPNEPLDVRQMADLKVELATVGPEDLIVLDGFNAAMTLQGLDLISNKDVTMFYLVLLKLLVDTGACIAYVDHTPKNDGEGESRGGIGAQAKRAMTTGTILRCDIKTSFGRNQTGYIAILVDKDRSGHVRECSPNRRVGSAKLESTTVDGINSVVVTIEEAEEMPVSTRADGSTVHRPTINMRRVSDYLSMNPGANMQAIKAALKGNADSVRKACELLVEEGYVAVTSGLRGSKEHRVVRPYLNDDSDLNRSDRPSPPSLTQSDPVRRPGEVTQSPSPSLSRGTGWTGSTGPGLLFDDTSVESGDDV